MSVLRGWWYVEIKAVVGACFCGACFMCQGGAYLKLAQQHGTTHENWHQART